MNPNLHVLTTNEQVLAALGTLREQEYVALDTETTGLERSDEIIGYSFCASDTDAYYVILSEWDTHLSQLVRHETHSTVKEAMRALQKKKLVLHNAVFDCAMIESNFKVSLIDSVHTCTMTLAHLLDENRPIGLKPLTAKLFGEKSVQEAVEMKASVVANGGIVTKADYQMYKADGQLMAKYGAKDAWLTYRLFWTLTEDLYEQGLDKFFYEDETMPLLKTATYELNTTGLAIDTKALQVLKKTLQAEIAADIEFIHNEIRPLVKDKYPNTNKKNKFNVDAGQQLAWLMFGVLGLEFSKLTKQGKEIAKSLGLKTYSPAEKRNFIHGVKQAKDTIWAPEGLNVKTGKVIKAKKVKDPWAYIGCDKTDFKRYTPKFKWIATLVEYKKKVKLLGTYVEGIESRTKYGIIQPSFLQTGTTSGRYSSRQPNFQNLPRSDKRVKSCIVARPGKVFVGADFSQLEPRVFAYVSQDKNLMEAFNKDQDFYAVIGMGVFGKYDCTASKDETPDAFKVKYASLRDSIKVFALASVYGASAWRLSKDTGKSVDDTQADIDQYFEQFPGVRTMMDKAHESIKVTGEAVSIYGRKRRMPEAKLIPKLFGNTSHQDLPYDYRKMLNLSVNHVIQSTGANIVNRAMIKVVRDLKNAGIEAKMVLQVHDEIVMECSDADSDNVALLLQNAMETTTELPGVPLEAVPRITKTLVK